MKWLITAHAHSKTTGACISLITYCACLLHVIHIIGREMEYFSNWITCPKSRYREMFWMYTKPDTVWLIALFSKYPPHTSPKNKTKNKEQQNLELFWCCLFWKVIVTTPNDFHFFSKCLYRAITRSQINLIRGPEFWGQKAKSKCSQRHQGQPTHG